MTTEGTQSRGGNSNQGMQSKTGKKQKNLYLSSHARQLLATLSLRMGVSETAIIELLVREKAARENITVENVASNSIALDGEASA